MPRPKRSIADRFWERVTKTETCWLWTGQKDKEGYGYIGKGGRYGGSVRVHRLSWQLAGRSLTTGLQLDHLCRVRACVNPAHLEEVSGRVNTLRGAHPSILAYHAGVCMRGHPKTRDVRGCAVCTKARLAATRERRAENHRRWRDANRERRRRLNREAKARLKQSKVRP